MNKKKWIFLAAMVFFFLSMSQAQDRPDIQFGHISPADFDLSAQRFDTGASAVVIADIGKTYFEGNKKSGMTMIFTRLLRVKILNKNGFSAADSRIALEHNDLGDGEVLAELKGSTYNLDNGVISETKLDQHAVFSEAYGKSWTIKTFTVPALRAGSVFDITYTIKSDFFDNLRSWSFQGAYPELWSEYEITIPPMFLYSNRQQGDLHFDINSRKAIYQSFTIIKNNKTQADDFLTLAGNSTQQRWVKKNVPALQEEPYTTTVDNYVSKISFQLNKIRWTQEDDDIAIAMSWAEENIKLLDIDEFGYRLNHDKQYMAEDVRALVSDCKTETDRMRKIYAFVRDNFSCSGHQNIYAESQLKDVYRKRVGSVAEINLLLIDLLHEARIKADPVILSTRDNGIANQSYPRLEDFNYVICQAYSGKTTFLLDASVPYSGFGHLVTACYNGYARVVNRLTPPELVNLTADSLPETSVTSVFIVNDEKGMPVGSLQTILGAESSYAFRKNLKELGPEGYFEKIKLGYAGTADISNTGIDSVSQYDAPITVRYDFDLKNLETGDLLYFNPMLSDTYKNNPFKSLERHYPVEMPYRLDQIYVLNMEIPKGYGVDEMPQSVKVLLGKDGVFEYLMQKTPTHIQLRVQVKLSKANFPTDEYPTILDFFAAVVRKENEQIVFKKIP